jgi:uncharacterized protein YggE
MKKVLIVCYLIVGSVLSLNNLKSVEDDDIKVVGLTQKRPFIEANPKCCKDCGTIDAVGTSKTSVTADQALVFASFCTKSPSAELAQNQNNIKVNNYISALQYLSNKIIISTDSISIFEDFKSNPDGTVEKIGWQACTSVTAKFSNMKLLARAIDLTSKNSASSVFTQFYVSDELNDKTQMNLLKLASENAKLKADISAYKGLGCKVVCAKSISVDEPYNPSLSFSKSSAAPSDSTTVIPGNVQLVRNVRVTFFIKC